MLKIVAPILVLLAGLAATYQLMATRPVLSPEKPVDNIPVVQVMSAEPQSVKLNVQTQGVVKARDSIDLIAEVSGKVVYLHPDFVAGGFFAKGEVLVRLDARDYDLAITQSHAQIAEARRLLATEHAQAEQAKTEWQALGSGQPTRLAMREPQLAEARAKLKSAEASLQQALLQRSRCELHAPFAGRFFSKAVSAGQIIKPGDSLAQLYATERAEVRLPISSDQMAYLDLPTRSVSYERGITVVLSAQLAGTTQSWPARIIRTEGIVDENTGVIYAVAEVKDPYRGKNNSPALWHGQFVQAEITGKVLADIFALPVTAVNSSQQVYIVDSHSKLHSRRLKVLRTESQRVLVRAGLTAGEQIVISDIDMPIENMAVKIENTPELNKP
ncbi:efflux RND transporter periplasmic adaptor subunit [Crenothrix polyspora]|uniref:Efflux transporter, RND family, MFP subunit n=1 Tax=Crenothrix polyspora TaxID=360316 RepID=A0A1R4H1G5_9GAMM|nr:efflux RND transporter periplasmic adaptor subunit [Crenothrix polyspora]SJM90083.1 Efflux transporter, RND family, MFP subunit [Crenothrix polyspora]